MDSTYALWNSITSLFQSKPELPPTDEEELIESGDIKYIPDPTYAKSEFDNYFREAPQAIFSSSSRSSSGSSTVRGNN